MTVNFSVHTKMIYKNECGILDDDGDEGLHFYRTEFEVVRC